MKEKRRSEVMNVGFLVKTKNVEKKDLDNRSQARCGAEWWAST